MSEEAAVLMVSYNPPRSVLAHRYAWELIRGPIPYGLEVCHDCPGGDNRACCNPEHLWLGTQQENIADAVKKKKFHGAIHPLKGEANPASKLRETQVLAICLKKGTQSAILVAEPYDCTPAVIRLIWNGTAWKYLHQGPTACLPRCVFCQTFHLASQSR